MELVSIDEAVKSLKRAEMTNLCDAFTRLGYLKFDPDEDLWINYAELMDVEGKLCEDTVNRLELCEDI